MQFISVKPVLSSLFGAVLLAFTLLTGPVAVASASSRVTSSVCSPARVRGSSESSDEPSASCEVLSTVRSADLILFLRHGEIVARGTHAELMEGNEDYRHLCRVQFGGEAAGG